MTTPATTARGGRSSVWTPESIIRALQRYAEVYGPDYTSAAFNPSVAKWRDDHVSAERYVLGDPDTGAPWPSLNTIKAPFGGSFNAAREAAGLPPNKPGPSKARPKRANGAHAPDRSVVHVTRQIVREREGDSAELVRARRELDKALARAQKAERALAEAKPKVVTKTKTVRDDAALRETRGELRAVKAELKRMTRDADKVAENALAERRVRLQAEAQVVLLTNKLKDRGATESREVAVPVEVEVERVVTKVVEKVVERPHPGELAIREATDLRRKAERRTREAQAEARRAEAYAAELAVAVKGEARKITPAEMAELRQNGPAGPQVLAQRGSSREGTPGICWTRPC